MIGEPDTSVDCGGESPASIAAALRFPTPPHALVLVLVLPLVLSNSVPVLALDSLVPSGTRTVLQTEYEGE